MPPTDLGFQATRGVGALKEITSDNIMQEVLSLNLQQVTTFNQLLFDADLLTQVNPKESAKRFFKQQKRLHKGKVKRLLAYVASCEEEQIRELLEVFFQEYINDKAARNI